MSILQIPRSLLPRIVPSSDPQTWGVTLKDGPFMGSLPVCGDLGDQQAALVGQTCFNTGEAKNTYGTGCFMLLNTGLTPVESKNGLLTTLAYQIGDKPAVYALEGSIAITGALVQWLRDNLKIIHTSSEIEELARIEKDNGGVYFVPAFSGLFAPYWRSDARGVIAGLTRYANRGHIARAALEATGRSLTLDNGKEFDRHEELARTTGMDVFFARPDHSWERGTNENPKGLIRRTHLDTAAGYVACHPERSEGSPSFPDRRHSKIRDSSLRSE